MSVYRRLLFVLFPLTVSIILLSSCTHSVVKQMNGYWHNDEVGSYLFINEKGMQEFTFDHCDWERVIRPRNYNDVKSVFESVDFFPIPLAPKKVKDLVKIDDYVLEDAWKDILDRLTSSFFYDNNDIFFLASYMEVQTEILLFSNAEGNTIIRFDYFGNDQDPLEWSLDESYYTKYDAQSEDNEGMRYQILDKTDIIERAFVNSFNYSPNQSITFDTGLSVSFSNVEFNIYFSITPKKETGTTNDGYCLFWYKDRGGRVCCEGRGEYERIGNSFKVYNVYDNNSSKRFNDRKYTIETNGLDITLSGEYIQSVNLFLKMKLLDNERLLSRSIIMRKP